MKIERLTENKIRVIINLSELPVNDSDINNFMNNNIESQKLFLDILKRAEQELDFYTDGYKLLIEAFSSLDDFFVFTITKYVSNNVTKNSIKCKPIPKRKNLIKINKQAICLFENFDTFCEFCCAIKGIHKTNLNNLIKNASLYFWNDCYYLILKNIDTKSENCYLLYSMLSEFTKVISFSDTFEAKLLEYGKVIMKKNAINTGIKFFANN